MTALPQNRDKAESPAQPLPLSAPLPGNGYAAGLAAIVLMHAALAVWFHWNRPFMGDEWGSYAALSWSYQPLLKSFRGWTTMNFYLAGLKLIYDNLGGRNWLLVIPGLLCSCWLVLLAANLARKFGGSRPSSRQAPSSSATPSPSVPTSFSPHSHWP